MESGERSVARLHGAPREYPATDDVSFCSMSPQVAGWGCAGPCVGPESVILHLDGPKGALAAHAARERWLAIRNGSRRLREQQRNARARRRGRGSVDACFVALMETDDEEDEDSWKSSSSAYYAQDIPHRAYQPYHTSQHPRHTCGEPGHTCEEKSHHPPPRDPKGNMDHAFTEDTSTSGWAPAQDSAKAPEGPPPVPSFRPMGRSHIFGAIVPSTRGHKNGLSRLSSKLGGSGVPRGGRWSTLGSKGTGGSEDEPRGFLRRSYTHTAASSMDVTGTLEENAGMKAQKDAQAGRTVGDVTGSASGMPLVDPGPRKEEKGEGEGEGKEEGMEFNKQHALRRGTGRPYGEELPLLPVEAPGSECSVPGMTKKPLLAERLPNNAVHRGGPQKGESERPHEVKGKTVPARVLASTLSENFGARKGEWTRMSSSSGQTVRRSASLRMPHGSERRQGSKVVAGEHGGSGRGGEVPRHRGIQRNKTLHCPSEAVRDAKRALQRAAPAKTRTTSDVPGHRETKLAMKAVDLVQ